MRIRSILLLTACALFFCCTGCHETPVLSETTTETEAVSQESLTERQVTFVSGTTFSGAKRPVVTDISGGYEIAAMPVLAIDTDTGRDVESKEEYVTASLSLYGCEEKYILENIPVEIRGRGNNSWTYPKKSYKIKLTKKENLLGLANGKERIWCLLANQCDMSLQRNRVSFEFCRYMSGIAWSPACTPVEVYLNGEYIGAYLLVEEIKVSGDRVNIADKDPDAVDTGYLVEMSNYAEGDSMFHVNGRAYMVQSDLSENRKTKQEQLAWIRDYITDAYDALDSGDRAEAEKYIDLESLLAVYLVEETVLNLDSQWDSFYMYKDAGGRLTFGPVWDFDLTMGNADDGSDNPEQIFVGNGRGSGNSADSWFGLAMSARWFREMVAEKWLEVYDSFRLMPDFIRDEAEIGMESYCRNFEKWPIFGQKQNRETDTILKLKNYEEHYTYLANWLEKRIAWLDSLFRDPAFVTSGKGLDSIIANRKAEELVQKSVLNVRDNYFTITREVDLSTVTAPEGFSGEQAENLFDNEKHTKYCVDGEQIEITFRMKSKKVLGAYMLRTGDDTADYPDRNPDSWTIYGSDDGENWNTLRVSGSEPDLLYGTNLTWFGFTLDNDRAYEWYRFTFTVSGTFQLSELWLGEPK
ncbi:MAG: hypothetical protein E7631_11645 [Ruminococcaceae bacterium]|nr:hypothetical protein [Oscillospiraceae bacterium]